MKIIGMENLADTKKLGAEENLIECIQNSSVNSHKRKINM